MATNSSKWLGTIKGHVGEAKAIFADDKRTREAAEKAPNSIILTERDLKSGVWDASKVLLTTLGGGKRPITADDLATFRRNMQTAQRRFELGKSGQGLTARQIIDLATSAPLTYKPNPDGYGSDIDKARKEITMAVAVSALNDEVRFLTNAGPESDVTRHHVVVRFNAFDDAVRKLAAKKLDDATAPKQMANWLRKQKLAFDCDCGRHRYFLRYVATIGGFAAGRPEMGYPKIRNPGLQGVACKHVLRVMSELESSNLVLKFLTGHLTKLHQSVSNKARTQSTQKDAEAAIENGRTREIKTSDMRKEEARKAAERKAIKEAASKAKRTTTARKPLATRRIEAALLSGKLTEAALATFREYGFSDAKIDKLVAKKK
ncbi:hypothetical protein [Macromonas bipunctata]|uniref:hypothetical protein n=1 Tax=Macromonas bipunctata TaxID=183670 RepID=UPI000C31D2DA|nr:hypothetical protein [Macromonas bipunctata]